MTYEQRLVESIAETVQAGYLSDPRVDLEQWIRDGLANARGQDPVYRVAMNLVRARRTGAIGDVVGLINELHHYLSESYGYSTLAES